MSNKFSYRVVNAMMDAAQDNIALIWETMAAISRELIEA